jgi:hypothetical protein
MVAIIGKVDMQLVKIYLKINTSRSRWNWVYIWLQEYFE